MYTMNDIDNFEAEIGEDWLVDGAGGDILDIEEARNATKKCFKEKTGIDIKGDVVVEIYDHIFAIMKDEEDEWEETDENNLYTKFKECLVKVINELGLESKVRHSEKQYFDE